MSSVNKAIIVGRVGKDPEIRSTAGGTTVANLSIATSEKWRDKQTGETKEKTEWHRVKFFGRTAEVIGEYVSKGSLMYVEGRIETDKYTDKEGVERYSTGILGDRMQLLGGKPDSKRQERESAKPSFDDDDIPF